MACVYYQNTSKIPTHTNDMAGLAGSGLKLNSDLCALFPYFLGRHCTIYCIYHMQSIITHHN